jgi:DNA-binding Lrp family transcriptional regulator
MPEAFVLINCDLGKEQEVVECLQTLETVKEVQATNGVYDVIAKLESETEAELNYTIKSKILEIKPVNCVLTLQSE